MIEGSLRNVPLTDVFQVVASSQKSGILTLVRGVVRARVYFDTGRIQYAHISPGVHLGEILVRMDLVATHEVQEILLRQSQENPGTPLGLTAIELGFIDQAELRMALERQVVEVLTELLGWRNGSFSFAERSGHSSQVPTEHSLDAMSVLMEVVRHLDDFEDGAVERDRVFQRSGDPTKAALPEGAWDVLSAIDGRRNAASVAAEVDLPERRVYRILHELEELGVIEPLPFAVEDPLVLVVSPSSALQRLVRLSLQRARLDPQLALDYEGGLAFIRERRPNAVVVDDEAGAGWRFVRELRSLPGMRHTPVVVLVRGEEDEGIWARLRRPKAHVMEKPFHELEFQELITRLVGRPLN